MTDRLPGILHTMQGAFFASAIALFALFGPAPALAQSNDERARLHFDSGTAYYDAGDYEDALREFQNAYELSERAGLLYNLYLCHERLGNLDEAIASLDGYLTDGDPAERREVLETRLANLRERAERQAEPEPEPEPELERNPNPEPEPEPEPNPSENRGGLPTPVVVSIAIAGAGAATWAVFGILAATENGRLGDECKLVQCTPDDVSSLRTYNTIADISFAVFIAAGVTGALLWLLLDDDGGGSRASIAPYMNGEGGGLVATGRL
jgi:tetratricopeptide (TPR) repeat protein